MESPETAQALVFDGVERETVKMFVLEPNGLRRTFLTDPKRTRPLQGGDRLFEEGKLPNEEPTQISWISLGTRFQVGCCTIFGHLTGPLDPT
jgi:hypothetical protein